MSVDPDVLVVGGGPAGLAAAQAASTAGANVILVDENSELGGNLRYRVQPVMVEDGEAPVRPAALRESLVSTAARAGADLRPGVIAAGWYAGGRILLVQDDTARVVTPRTLVVATGSTDLPFPFAGATLPGVFTARAVQILLNHWRVLPGQRFAVIGPEREASEVAIDIALAGGEVVIRGIAPAHLLRAVGTDGVQAFQFNGERYEVDCVVIAMGRQPDAALATMAGARLGFSPGLGGLAPLVSEHLEAARNVFVAGEAAGICGVAVALAEGHLAGLAAVAASGRADTSSLRKERTRGGEELRRRDEHRRALRPVYAQPYV